VPLRSPPLPFKIRANSGFHGRSKKTFVGDSMMEFKEMTVNDVTEVAKLYNELACFIKIETKDEYFNFDILSETELEKQLKESIGKPTLITFVAKDDSNVIAFISGKVKENFLPISKTKEVGYVNGAYVLPKYRKQGIMKKLENMLSDYFKEQGLTYVELNVITNNLIGKRSWELMGYKTFREQMRKKIQKTKSSVAVSD
jgi:ribosomal protein S18 acetylase RimI-like enzyme